MASIGLPTWFRVMACSLVVLLVVHSSRGASISLRSLEPQRPDQFKSVEELRQYLKDLHEYYSVVGRPRFGRSVEIPFLEDALADVGRRNKLQRILSEIAPKFVNTYSDAALY